VVHFVLEFCQIKLKLMHVVCYPIIEKKPCRP
jgi:hypothetical protein